MKNNSTIITLLSVVVSIVLIVVFIVPKFDDIRALQDDIALYDEQAKNIEQINAQLQSLVTNVNNVSATNQSALIDFLPDEVDEIAVLRTLENIANVSGVGVRELEYSESDIVEGRNVQAHSFDFSVAGQYEVLFNFFALLEQNEYLFEVREVEFTTDIAGVLSASGELVVYSFFRDEESLTGNVR